MVKKKETPSIHKWIVAREGKMSQLKFLEVSIESISKRWPDYLCVCVCLCWYTAPKNMRLKMNTHHGWWRWRWWSQQPLTHSHEWRQRHHINALSSGCFFYTPSRSLSVSFSWTASMCLVKCPIQLHSISNNCIYIVYIHIIKRSKYHFHHVRLLTQYGS